ncbi:unnamed protein product [Paramecium primaurelia]|uniref:Uncharacterized protein n=1 Tax=Paramecium primaurelia TaxID=5886 RepID=A0A8S1LG72_PARPR|nr:unnamed protein product [Paramecium primaurelia]
MIGILVVLIEYKFQHKSKIEQVKHYEKLTNKALIYNNKYGNQKSFSHPLMMIYLKKSNLDDKSWINLNRKKEEKLNQMENELNILQKDLQDERIQKLDQVNLYQQQLEEVVRLQKNDLETFSQQTNQFYLQFEDLQNENQDLKSKINTFQITILQQKQQIALLEDQLNQLQSYQLSLRFLLLISYLKFNINNQNPNLLIIKNRKQGNQQTNRSKTQVIQTLNGTTDDYEYSSIQDPNNPRKSLASRLDQVNIQPSSNIDTRNSKLQNNISQSSFQRGQTYISDQYKKDFIDLKHKLRITCNRVQINCFNKEPDIYPRFFFSI